MPDRSRSDSRRGRSQPSDPSAHPRDLVHEAVTSYGLHAAVDTCCALLEGHEDYDKLPVPLSYLGGSHATAMLRRGDLVRRGQDYWPRVWGARGLRYVWLDYAEQLVPLVDSGVSRVRVAAIRAVGVVGEYEHAELIQQVADPDPAVAVAGDAALRRTRARLDRDL